MLSPLSNTLPTFTIGTKVGLSMSTSFSSGFTRSWPSFCAHELATQNNTKSMAIQKRFISFTIYVQVQK